MTLLILLTDQTTGTPHYSVGGVYYTVGITSIGLDDTGRVFGKEILGSLADTGRVKRKVGVIECQ